MSSDGSRRPRTPGLVFAALALLLVVLLAAIALTVNQPPPPTIAEFAPQSVENITDAPTDQSSSAGKGAGDCAAGQVCGPGEGGGGALTPAPEPVVVARVRKCVGDPPRQIEDPQSPPCVPYWAGDNGGVTTRGVTRDEIRVALATGNPPLTREETGLQAFFNKRFEFYGRKIALKRFAPSGDITSVGMAANAEKVDAEIDPFAALSFTADLAGRDFYYYDELARRKILSVQDVYTGPPSSSEAHFRQYAPYQWNYVPTPDDILANAAKLVCTQLRGGTAQYAGAPEVTRQRVFAIANQLHPDGAPPVDTKPFHDGLKACGASAKEVTFQADQGAGPDHAQAATNVILQLQQAGVTTILCTCHIGRLTFDLMPAATGQNYYPEWVISNFGHQDDDFAGRTFPAEHAVHVIGLRSRNKQLGQDQTPWIWALKEADPSYGKAVSLENQLYTNLLVLASGIQMAGPRLTAQSFETGLFKTKFPNPGYGAPPYYQARVGFEGGYHTMVNDYAPVWWSSTDASYTIDGQQGAYCYVGQGTRFGLRSTPWPDERRLVFQQPPCR